MIYVLDNRRLPRQNSGEPVAKGFASHVVEILAYTQGSKRYETPENAMQRKLPLPLMVSKDEKDTNL